MPIGTSKMFDNYKQMIKGKQSSGNSKSKNVDERFVAFMAQNSYRFRLLFFLNDKSDRKTPFIEQFIHTYYDPETKSRETIICPTSEYIKGNFGFNMCPTCTNNSKLWKEIEKGNKSSGELYDQLKRRFHGYALVYVVNDGFNPENNGKVKLMHFGKDIKKFFKAEIIGTETSVDPIGSAAFDLENGYDLLITVTDVKSGEETYKHYECKFAREKTTIHVDLVKLETEIKALRFDEDYFKVTPAEDLQKFYQNYILEKITANNDIEEELVQQPVETKKTSTVPSNTKVETVETIDEVMNTPTTPAPAPISSVEKKEKPADDFDLDSILAEIDGK